MHRFSLLATAAVAVLVVAGLASATPRLIISGTTVQILEDKSDAAPAHISIYVPTGYTAALTQTPGAQIGTVHADLQALAISPDAIIQADGTVLAADPTTAALQTSGAQCTGTGTHAGIWLLHVIVSGTTLDVPVYVDPTSGSSTALGVAVLQLCLPDPYDNAPAATRSAFGAKIINAAMSLNANVITAPATGGLWRSVITPWNTATPAANLAGTIEAQSIVGPAGTATLKTKVTKSGKRHTVRLSGSVSEGGTGVSGAAVTLTAGGKKIATVKTSSTGSFSKSVAITKKTKYQAKAAVAQRDTACISALPPTAAPGGCQQATIAGYTATSAAVTAHP
ncbi:MAG: hypothetical protein ACYDA3_04320 [Gaiellaceae bacterium]